MPVTSTMPMLLRASAPGPDDEHQRQVTEHGRRRRHQHRPQPRQRRLADRVELREPARLQRVRELHDQDAVLRDQADQRDQTDLRVDVDRGQVQEREHQRAGDRQRHRAEQHDQRIAEALELRGEHQVDEDEREAERRRERRAFLADLARLAGVVERHVRAARLGRRVFEHAQPFVLGDAGLHAAEDTRRSCAAGSGSACAAPVLVSMRVNVDTGTSSPSGVLIFRSSSGSSVARSSSPICGITL